MDLVNCAVVNGEGRSQNRYLTVVNRRNCRFSAGIDPPLRVIEWVWAPKAPFTLYRNTPLGQRDFDLQGDSDVARAAHFHPACPWENAGKYNKNGMQCLFVGLFVSVVDLPTLYAMIVGTPTQCRTPLRPRVLGICKGLRIEIVSPYPVQTQWHGGQCVTDCTCREPRTNPVRSYK